MASTSANDPTTTCRQGRRGRPRRWVGPALALAVALAASACQPIPHGAAAVVDPATTIRAISADGTFAVVTATGPTSVVPGAGTWRVNRLDHTVVEIPNAPTPLRISADGERITYRDATNTLQIWVQGTVRTPPVEAQFSPDLRWALMVDLIVGRARRWDATTGGLVNVETGFPRPEPYTVASSWSTWAGIPDLQGVDDSGQLTWFTLVDNSTGACLVRFIDLAAGQATDHLGCHDRMVAGNGSRHLALRGIVGGNPFVPIGGPTQVDLVESRTGVVERTLVSDHTYFEVLGIGQDGWAFWVADVEVSGTFPPDCGGMGNPVCSGTVEARSIVAATPNRVVPLPVTASKARWNSSDPVWATLDPSGRFLAYVDDTAGTPTRLLDWVTGTVETLSPPAGVVVDDLPLLTTEARVVAGRAPTAGWFEHLATA